MSSAFRRALPARPDLEQQKKLAKELLRAYRAGDADAVARIREELPDKPDVSLTDAQLPVFGSEAKKPLPERSGSVETVQSRSEKVGEVERRAIVQAEVSPSKSSAKSVRLTVWTPQAGSGGGFLPRTVAVKLQNAGGVRISVATIAL